MLAKLKEHWQFITLFVLSTSFFIYQHFVDHGLWDFYVYLMNGKYWFHNGFYFELYRAPLMPLLLGIFGANLYSEYIYIVFTSALFAYATYKLAKQININEIIFYALLLNVYTLIWGLSEGTELLSLALLELGIYFVLKGKEVSGVPLALSVLARYTMAPYGILLLFQKNWKKIIFSIILFISVLTPWLVYNKIFFGNYFASIADSYALNVYFRPQKPIEPMHFVIAGNILWISFALGLSKSKLRREEIIMLTVFAIAVINYALTPFKFARYLFPMILPLSFFSAKYIKDWKTAFAIFLVMLTVAFVYQPKTPAFYMYPIQKIKELHLENCEIESNIWPLLNYGGLPTSPAVWPENTQKEVDKGKILILYTGVENFGNAEPVLYNNSNYIIYGYKNCTERKYNKIIFIYLKDRNYNLHLMGINKTYSYCDVFFPRICYLINKI